MKRKMSMSYFSNLRNHREFTSRKNYENIFGYRVYLKNEATGMKFICEATKFHANCHCQNYSKNNCIRYLKAAHA